MNTSNSLLESHSRKLTPHPRAKRTTGVLLTLAVATLTCFTSSCTSEPIISRNGVSGVALGEVGIEALLAASALGGGGSTPKHLGNFETSDTTYLGGFIPIKQSHGSDRSIDNGTKFFVDGRKRGCLPRVLEVAKPGPHLIRIEIPAFQPYELTLSETIQIQVGQQSVEAWPPVIVDCLSGEIFTTRETATVNPDRNSGKRRPTDLTKKVGDTPILIVTTTEKQQPGWRKIGQLHPSWRNGAR